MNIFTDQKALYDLKREISVSSKKNFALERDIRTLDKKIALLIKNRISLEVLQYYYYYLIDIVYVLLFLLLVYIHLHLWNHLLVL